jgi:protein-S-isoprenylcysteine O-methyltransferase Ste14
MRGGWPRTEEEIMTLVPDFEPGLWNAWIIMVTFYVASFLPLFAGGKKADARMQGEPSFGEAGVGARVGTIITHAVLMPLTLIYSFFVPLEQGNWWLYSGLIVSAVAIVMALAASISFVTAPIDEPMTTGVYAISRNPMYVAGVLVYAGIGLAGASWVFLVFAVVEMAAWAVAVPQEERNMIAKYGTAYEDYMRRTPRWIGFPKARQPVAAS